MRVDKFNNKEHFLLNNLCLLTRRFEVTINFVNLFYFFCAGVNQCNAIVCTSVCLFVDMFVRIEKSWRRSYCSLGAYGTFVYV